MCLCEEKVNIHIIKQVNSNARKGSCQPGEAYIQSTLGEEGILFCVLRPHIKVFTAFFTLWYLSNDILSVKRDAPLSVLFPVNLSSTFPHFQFHFVINDDDVFFRPQDSWEQIYNNHFDALYAASVISIESEYYLDVIQSAPLECLWVMYVGDMSVHVALCSSVGNKCITQCIIQGSWMPLYQFEQNFWYIHTALIRTDPFRTGHIAETSSVNSHK